MVAAKVTVRHPVHQPVAKRIEQLAGTLLRNAIGTAAGLCKRRHSDVGWAGERGIGRCCKIRCKLPDIQRLKVTVVTDHVLRRTRGRRRGAVEVRRQQRAVIRIDINALHCGVVAHQHAAPVQRTGRSSQEAIALELVVGDVVGIVPDRQLWIIGEIPGGDGDSIAIPATHHIGSCRDSHAEVIGGLEHGLHHHPPPCLLVILGNGVPTVVARAGSPRLPAHAGPQRVPRHRAVSNIATALVKDGKRCVHPLHKLRIARGAVGVGGNVLDGEIGQAAAHAKEILPCTGRRTGGRW